MTNLSNRQNDYRKTAEKRALYLNEQATKQNFLRKFVSLLKQENNALMNLNQILSESTPYQHRQSNLQNVAIAQIQGSANGGRTHDFDADFRPTSQHTKSRWVGLATARTMGKRIPPVQLVTVEGIPGLEKIFFWRRWPPSHLFGQSAGRRYDSSASDCDSGCWRSSLNRISWKLTTKGGDLCLTS